MIRSLCNLSLKESFIRKPSQLHPTIIVNKTRNQLTTNQWIEKVFEIETPCSAFYVVNLNKVIDQHSLWKKIFPKIKPYYAVKCNPNKVVLKLLASLGVDFDVASRGEIDLIKEFNTDVIYANPYKEAKSLQYARTMDVNMTTFDSEYELKKISLYHPECKLFLRLKVDDKNSIVKFSEKFGANYEEARHLIKKCEEGMMDLVGLSFHVGSACQDTSQYSKAIELCSELSKEFDKKFIIDIGGGFPGSNDLLFEKIGKEINSAIKKYTADHTIIAEPGRFFSESSHTLLVSVIGKKIRDGVRYYYINDGLYGSFNCMIYDHQEPKLVPYKNNSDTQFKSMIFGPTCDGFDKIAEDIQLPELELGDWLFVEKFGSYTIAGSSDFNGFSKTQAYYTI